MRIDESKWNALIDHLGQKGDVEGVVLVKAVLLDLVYDREKVLTSLQQIVKEMRDRHERRADLRVTPQESIGVPEKIDP